MVGVPFEDFMTPENRTVAIIQGRMDSSRLPGKILQEIGGLPMLMRVVERVRLARSVDEVVFATTTDPSDDSVEMYCREQGVPCFRGSLHDVLDRFYQAALAFQAETVVRLTADCPLLDPGLVDETVGLFRQEGADFAANRLPPPFQRTYPIGLDVEVCSFSALQRAWQEASAPHDREHVLPYLYEVAGRFKVAILNYAQDYGSLRWTVDTPQDLELIRQLYARLQRRSTFSWLDVLATIAAEPHLAQINAAVEHKTMFDVDDRYKK
jgi:spore coat polysaccharide biosynthesis protein SpsF